MTRGRGAERHGEPLMEPCAPAARAKRLHSGTARDAQCARWGAMRARARKLGAAVRFGEFEWSETLFPRRLSLAGRSLLATRKPNANSLPRNNNQHRLPPPSPPAEQPHCGRASEAAAASSARRVSAACNRSTLLRSCSATPAAAGRNRATWRAASAVALSVAAASPHLEKCSELAAALAVPLRM